MIIIQLVDYDSFILSIFYFSIKLPNKTKAYLHLGRYKNGHIKEGKYYFYSITTYTPKKLESI